MVAKYIDRPYGGIGVLWKKSLGEKCNIVYLDDTRLMAMEVKMDDKSILLINVYMPFDALEKKDEFLQSVGKIDMLVESYNSPYMFVLGDFNLNLEADDIGVINSQFGKLLNNHCREENLVIADCELLGKDSFTFVSHAHNTTSWLDYVITISTGVSLGLNIF